MLAIARLPLAFISRDTVPAFCGLPRLLHPAELCVASFYVDCPCVPAAPAFCRVLCSSWTTEISSDDGRPPLVSCSGEVASAAASTRGLICWRLSPECCQAEAAASQACCTGHPSQSYRPPKRQPSFIEPRVAFVPNRRTSHGLVFNGCQDRRLVSNHHRAACNRGPFGRAAGPL